MRSVLTLIVIGVVSNSVSACSATSSCNDVSDAGRDSARESINTEVQEGAKRTASNAAPTSAERRAEIEIKSVANETNDKLLLADNTASAGASRPAQPLASTQRSAPISSTADNSAIGELLVLLKKSEQLQARFQQEMRDQQGQLLDQSSGQVRWKKPLSFRWDIEQPFSQSIIVHEGKHYQYDEDLEQLIIRELSDEVAALPRVILSGNEAAIRESYRVKKIRAVEAAGGAATNNVQAMFQLEPLAVSSASQSEILAVLLVFSDHVLSEISVVDSLQQTSRFELSEHITKGLGQSDFELDLPEGIETIYQ